MRSMVDVVLALGPFVDDEERHSGSGIRLGSGSAGWIDRIEPAPTPVKVSRGARRPLGSGRLFATGFSSPGSGRHTRQGVCCFRILGPAHLDRRVDLRDGLLDTALGYSQGRW